MNQKITFEERIKIEEMLKAEEKQVYIAKIFNISQQRVSEFKRKGMKYDSPRIYRLFNA